MPATTSIQVFLGASAGTTVQINASELRHKRADNITADLNNPVPIPATPSGINYSYRKHTKMIFVDPPNAQITDLRWFAEDKSGLAGWAGITLYAGLTPTASYQQGAASPDNTTQIPASQAAEAYTASTPLVVTTPGVPVVESGDTFPTDAGATYGGAGSQNYVVQQIGIGGGAGSGVVEARDLFYRMNEI